MATHIKAGEIINGYTFSTDAKSADAGTCIWGFAKKSGVEYFIKCYLSPVYPVEGTPGSEKAKRKKRDQCLDFENRVIKIESALDDGSVEGGFIVKTIDFFRYGSNYFKVTEKITNERINVFHLDERRKFLVLLTVAYGFKMLHVKKGFIHADIKPENILIEKHHDRYISKIIDFDASFFSDNIPNAENIIGDQRYWSPEILSYTLGKEPAKVISQKTDIFSIGILFCKYITDSLPVFDKKYSCTGEAILNKSTINIPKIKSKNLAKLSILIEKMLDGNQNNRPSIHEVHESIRNTYQSSYSKSAKTKETSEITHEEKIGDITSKLKVDSISEEASLSEKPKLKIFGSSFDSEDSKALKKGKLRISSSLNKATSDDKKM